jgi:mRNA-degrading endonuclease RelE of RelBE toxin-antitoxin system
LSCIIDDEISPDFERQKKSLRKKYHRLEADVAHAFEGILKDFRTACNAVPVPGHAGKVWKYRFKNSDNNRGQSSGYRILAYYLEPSNTLVPFSIYTHDDYPAQPPTAVIERWLQTVLAKVARGELPRGPFA